MCRPSSAASVPRQHSSTSLRRWRDPLVLCYLSAMDVAVKMGLKFALQHLPEVVGVGSQEDKLIVLCSTHDVLEHVPSTFEGYHVECQVTGPIVAAWL